MKSPIILSVLFLNLKVAAAGATVGFPEDGSKQRGLLRGSSEEGLTVIDSESADEVDKVETTGEEGAPIIKGGNIENGPAFHYWWRRELDQYYQGLSRSLRQWE